MDRRYSVPGNILLASLVLVPAILLSASIAKFGYHSLLLMLLFPGILVIVAYRLEKVLLYTAVATLSLNKLVMVSGISITLVIGLLYTFIWFMRAMAEKRRVVFMAEHKLFIALFAVILISSIAGVDQQNSIQVVRTYFQALLFAFLISNIGGDREIGKLIWVLIISISAVALLSSLEAMNIFSLGINELYESSDSRLESFVFTRQHATVGDPNFWAAILNIAISFILFKFFASRNPLTKLFLLLCMSTVMLSFYFTYSVGGFAGLCLIIVSVLFYILKPGVNRKILGSFAFLVLVVLFFVWMPEVYKYRLTFKLFEEGTASGRIYAWIGGLKLFAEHPFFGIGPGNSMWEMPRYAILNANLPYLAVHNAFLHVAIEMGITGLTVFIGILFLVIRRLISAQKAQSGDDLQSTGTGKAILISILAFLLQAMALDLQESKYLYILIGLAIAYGVSVESEDRRAA